MSIARCITISRNDLRILRRDPLPLILLIVMPLVVMLFVERALRLALHAEGLTSTNGAEQAVPGMQVVFGFFLASQVSYGLFSEHSWCTWSRLRSSPASTSEILAGKLVVPFLEAALQFGVLFGFGVLVLHLRVHGSWLQLLAVASAFSLALVALGVAITALCRSVIQVSAIVNVAALMLSGLGGALVPESLLPHWATIVAPAVPSYWAMRGYRDGIFGRGGGGFTPVAVLLGYALIFTLVAQWRLQAGERKIGLA